MTGTQIWKLRNRYSSSQFLPNNSYDLLILYKIETSGKLGKLLVAFSKGSVSFTATKVTCPYK